MLLKKLDIYGFKSFADRISMKFDKGITAIVGPNGCGKSNVADAVRWVLGEQSAKSLRGSKMEDVIFSGTQLRKSLGFAEVSLTLDNSDGALPVDFSEVTITRRMFRSGESEYFINKTPCRLKDIIELFMDTGVGKEGYSIIGQGRIDEILSTRSEDRRYIFEEAAGIVKYKARRDEAEKKLEKTKQNLMRAEDILSELEQQLSPLEEQAKNARKYLKLKEKLKFYEINKFLHQYSSHTQKIHELKEQIKKLKEDIDFRKARLSEIEKQKQNLSQSLNLLHQEIDETKRQCYDLTNSSEKLKGEQKLNLERIQQYERENNRLKEEIQRRQEEMQQAEEQITFLNAAVEKRRKEFEKLHLKADFITNKLEEANKKIDSFQHLIDETKGDIIQILNKISDCKNQLTRYQTIESSLKDRLKNIEELIANKKNAQDELGKRLKSLHNSIMLTKLNFDELTERRLHIEQKINSGKKELRSIEEQLNKERQILEGRSSRLKLLEDMRRGYEGFNKTVKEIMTACQSNPTMSRKVCGVVASLIHVPKDYEVAIETVLGSSLQYIVTEDEEDAKYLINFLRENNYGRTTFLPISSVQCRRLNSKERNVLAEKGCLGIASELVECDPKYKNIIDHLLGRVVIAEELDSAISIAKLFSYSFKIVTIKGDIINPGGSITGGSNSIRSISILRRKREIAELRKEIINRKKIINELEKQYGKLKEEYNDNKAFLEKLDTNIHKTEMQLSSEEENLNRLLLQQADAESEIIVLENEKKEIYQNLKELKNSILEAKTRLDNLEIKNRFINEETKEFESRLKEKLNERDKIIKEQTDLRVQLFTLQQELRNLKEQVGHIKKKLVHLYESIEIRRKQIRDNNDKITSIQSSIENNKAKISNMEKEVTQLKASIENMENKRSKDEIRLSEVEQELKDINKIIQDITDNKHRVDIQCSRYEVELENIQNNIWEEYEVTWKTASDYRDEKLTLSTINKQIQLLKSEIDKMGDINVSAIEEFKRVNERYQFMIEQKNDLITAGKNLRNVISEITTTMEKQFREEFAVINEYFGESFRKLFGGGQAKLVLEDPNDVLNCGIEIIAQPPGKKLQNLLLLSGGERAITAIAILFAILRHKPTPFCVLDEIDAALDDSNVYQFGKYIREFSNETQFVIITHRKGTMEVSDVLYGIAMEEKGVSKLISVKFDEMVS